jgi:hypothetical protein
LVGYLYVGWRDFVFHLDRLPLEIIFHNVLLMFTYRAPSPVVAGFFLLPLPGLVQLTQVPFGICQRLCLRLEKIITTTMMRPMPMTIHVSSTYRLTGACGICVSHRLRAEWYIIVQPVPDFIVFIIASILAELLR